MTTTHKSRTTKPDWRDQDRIDAERNCPVETIADIQARNGARRDQDEAPAK